MSEVTIGYAPTGGRLILGRHRDAWGRWVEPVYPLDEMMAVIPTELDKAVLGADTEYVIVVWRNDGGEERYRVGADMSWHGLSDDDAPREDEILQEAARRRIDPEDGEIFDPRTLANVPAANEVGPHVGPAQRRPPVTPRGATGHEPEPGGPTSVAHSTDVDAPGGPPAQGDAADA